MRLRILLAAVTAGIHAAPAPLHAAPPAPAPAPAPPDRRSADCDFVHALSDVVTAEERDNLLAFCRGGGNLPTAGLAMLLLSRQDWNAGALALLFTPGDGWGAAWDAGEITRKLLACDDFRDDRARYLNSLKTAGPSTIPFHANDLVASKRCDVKIDPSRPQYLLTIRADDLQALDVVAATPDTWSVQRFTDKDFVPHGAHRLLVVAVPKGALVTVRRKLTNVAIPALDHLVASGDYSLPLWTEGPPLHCHALSITKEPGSIVLFDGEKLPLPERKKTASPPPPGRPEKTPVGAVLQVPAGDHEVLVMTPDGRGRWKKPTPARISAAEVGRAPSLCHEVRIDASINSAVSILKVNASPACERTPVDTADILADAERHLGHRLDPQDRLDRDRRKFLNLQNLGRYSSALAELKTQLDPRADPNGATRVHTREDALATLEALAATAWRQGIGTLLSIDVRCTPTTANGWTYTVATHVIPVSELANRPRDPIRGANLEALFEAETEAGLRLEDISTALEMTLDRSLGIPYVRFFGDNIESDASERRTLSLASFLPSPPDAEAEDRGTRHDVAFVRTIPVSGADKSDLKDVCRGFTSSDPAERTAALEKAASRGLLRSKTMPLLGGVKQAGPAADGFSSMIPGVEDRVFRETVPHGVVRRDRLSLRYNDPGLTILLAGTSHAGTDTREYTDARCIEWIFRNDLWAEVSMMGLTGARRWKDVLHLELLLGHTWYGPPFRSRECISAHDPRPCRLPPQFGVALAAGYGFTRSYGEGPPPGWQDLGVPIDSSARYTWDRHAILVTGSVEARTRFDRVPVDLFIRATPIVSAGWTANKGVPAALQSFRADDQFGTKALKFDLDVGLFADLGIIYMLRRFVLQTALRVGSQSLVEPRDEHYNVLDDRGLFVGASLRLGGGL